MLSGELGRMLNSSVFSLPLVLNCFTSHSGKKENYQSKKGRGVASKSVLKVRLGFLIFTEGTDQNKKNSTFSQTGRSLTGSHKRLLAVCF